MRHSALAMLASAALLSPAAAASGAAAQPPMGQFNGAYYSCDKGQGFEISYDSKTPNSATVTTSDNNARHQLKRVSEPQGTQFSDGTVTVAVTSQGAQVTGTHVALTGCKLKTTT